MGAGVPFRYNPQEQIPSAELWVCPMCCCRSGSASRGRSVLGNTPSAPVSFTENGVKFRADVVVGQKTGFFLDQRDNRKLMQVGLC